MNWVLIHIKYPAGRTKQTYGLWKHWNTSVMSCFLQ